MRKNDLAIDSTLTSTPTASRQAGNIDVNSLEIPYIAWEIEKKCNMSCQFCYSSSWNKVRRGKNRTPPDPSVQSIIQGLELLKKSNLHIKYINWSGGEPLLRHKDLLTIFKESSRQGFKNILSTNCMFTPLFNEEKPEQKFRKLLDDLNDYLDFLSISWDAENEDCNNNVMRLNGGHHYKDVQTFLEIFKEERYTFKLKVNTLATRKNIKNVSGILNTLQDIPCLWKLVQFNPRECPEQYRREYEITEQEFLKLFDEINSRNNALPKASKCTIINRLYEGANEPYCFLVINTKGEVLLPKGETHVPLANIFEKDCNPNNFKEQVSQRIHKELVDAQVYKTKSEVGRKPPLEVFTEINNTILNRSYLHCKFNEDEAKRKINKLQSIERVLLSDVADWYSKEFYDAIEENDNKERVKEFLFNDNTNNDAKRLCYDSVKFLFEQEKVGKFLHQSWGIIGGTIAVLNYGNSKENSHRITPCVDRAPAGIHFPWCFDSFEKKREFFKKLFEGGIKQSVESDSFTTETFVEKFIAQRELPEDILSEAIKKTISSTPTTNNILESIKGYLNNNQFLKHKLEDWNKLSSISFILTNCVELILIKLASTFKKRIDPLHTIFQNQDEKEKSLSEVEKKLDVMMISAEESVSMICQWLSQKPLDSKLDSLAKWKKIKRVWMSLAEHDRVKKWQKYQKNKDKRKLQFNVSEGNPRILPDFFLFWLYLFTPFLENEKSLNIPHVLFIEMQKLIRKKSGNPDEDTISSFAAVYLNDEVFQRFWNSRKQIWCCENDVNEIDLKTYIHNVANLIYPVAAYNVNLELNEERKAEIVKHGTKAAITAIMSRNLSHNIGSHVLSYWNQKLDNLIDTSGSYDIKQTVIKKSKVLFQYIQHRMDFLAEISTSIPCSELSLDISSDILDPFTEPNSDKFDTIEKSERGISVLLKYIAESEGIDLHNKFDVIITKKLKSKRVSIPNGIIGIHAIYSILENFIRNAAKHYKGNQNGSTNNGSFIRIVIEKPTDKKWQKGYIVMSIWDMRKDSCDSKVVEKLRSYLPEWKSDDSKKQTDKSKNDEKYRGFVDNEGILKPGGWGTKEMLTCANFLRKNSPEILYEIFQKGYKKDDPPLLEILCSDEPEGKPCCIDSKKNPTNNCSHSESGHKNKLGIRFYLRKPKDLAVANNSKVSIKKNVFEIESISLRDYENKEIPHRILLIDSKYENNPKAPCRIRIKNNTSQVNDDYYLDLYEEFVKSEIIEDKNLPQMIFTGGGEYNKYSSLFNDIPEEYGKAVNENWNNGSLPIIESNKNFILFYHHARECDNINEDFLKNAKNNGMKYFQGISASHSFYTRATNLQLQTLNKKIKQHFCLEIIESAMTRVVIVDERVSEWADETYKGNIKVRDILKYMNVYVIEIKKEKITYSALKKSLNTINCISSEKENNNSKNSKPVIHFFVIHQGILDKIKKEEKGNSNNLLSKIACRWKVIDSGRGVPPELEAYKDVRFIEISALLKMLENYDKHALVQTLFSSRNPKL